MIAEYHYDANSQLIVNTRNGITTTYDYNELGQLETLTTTQLNENIMQFEYEYDKIGNIISEVRTEGTVVNNRIYDYDAANQLVSFSDNDYIETYNYDNVGNMLEKTLNGTATSYSYNKSNQLVQEVTGSEAIGYTYNKNGDLTYKTTGEQYSYDIQGNLTSIIGNGIDKQYTYNGNGNRLSETTDDNTIYYVNDINRRYEEVLQTYDEDGNVINTYTYGIDRINSVGQDNETYLYDGRGSVVGSVSEDVMTSYAYTAYGELMPNSPMPNVFGYNAEATDFITGIQYLRARYYDTTISGFFQEDDYRGDFVEPQTMNRYIYVGGNPVNRIDPSGYWSNPLKKIGSAISNVASKVTDAVTSFVPKAIDTGKKIIKTVSNALSNRPRSTVSTSSPQMNSSQPFIVGDSLKKINDDNNNGSDQTAFYTPQLPFDKNLPDLSDYINDNANSGGQSGNGDKRIESPSWGYQYDPNNSCNEFFTEAAETITEFEWNPIFMRWMGRKLEKFWDTASEGIIRAQELNLEQDMIMYENTIDALDYAGEIIEDVSEDLESNSTYAMYDILNVTKDYKFLWTVTNTTELRVSHTESIDAVDNLVDARVFTYNSVGNDSAKEILSSSSSGGVNINMGDVNFGMMGSLSVLDRGKEGVSAYVKFENGNGSQTRIMLTQSPTGPTLTESVYSENINGMQIVNSTATTINYGEGLVAAAVIVLTPVDEIIAAVAAAKALVEGGKGLVEGLVIG